jgi:hypothetical protein
MSTGRLIERKPALACLGTISDIQPTKVSKKETYLNVEFSMLMEGANRPQKGWLIFRPEYLRALNFKTIEKDRSQNFVYRANIGFDIDAKGKIRADHPQADAFYYGRYLVPTLVGLYGTDTKEVDDLTNELATITDDEELIATLDAALSTRKGAEVGFFLKQQYVDSKDELNDKGRPVKVRTPYMEFAGFFIPTRENLDKLTKDAEKANASARKKAENEGVPGGDVFQVTYDMDVPFSVGASASV